MTILIDLRKSEVCRSIGLCDDDDDAFQELFGFPAQFELTAGTLRHALKQCDYFMMDHEECLSAFASFQDQISVRTSASNLVRYLKTAFNGTPFDVVGSLDHVMIRWAHQTRKILKDTDACYRHLCSLDSHIPPQRILSILDLISGLTERRVRDPGVLRKAIQRGDTALIQWFLDHGSSLTEFNWLDAIKASSSGGHHLWEFLRSRGCPYNTLSVASAAAYGRLDFVRWWHGHGYPFCECTPAWAAIWGHVAIIQYVIDHRLPMNRSWVLSNAALSLPHLTKDYALLGEKLGS